MLSMLLAMASSWSVADDHAAFLRMAEGDQTGLADLYDRHGPFVYALALRIVHDEGDAEDVVQDVFVQIWRQSERFDAVRGNALAWLLTITRTRAIDLLRRRRVRPGLADGAVAAELPDLSMPADDQVDWSRRITAVRDAVNGLPLLQRLAIELAFFDGLTHVEIADRLELPLGTVKTRVRQGLLKLRSSLTGVP